MDIYDVIVVGAGPAGILAAGSAAKLGAKVLILEKMSSVGRKLLITGKGRCNVTNGASASDFLSHVYPDSRFLRPALSEFNSNDIIQLLDNHGVQVVEGPNNRYFPASDKAADVLKALLNWVNNFPIDLKVNSRVTKIVVEDGTVKGAEFNGQVFPTNAVIIATGGKSYPATGSTGDGYELARQLGHSIVKPIPALVPLETKGSVVRQLQGLNLTDIKAIAWVNNRKVWETRGEMIFTHFGLSGPAILTLSRFVVNPLQNGDLVKITIDFFPDSDDQSLDKKLQNDINTHGRKKIINMLHLWLPASLVPVFMAKLELDDTKEAHQITGKERKNIVGLLKSFPLEISHNRSFKDAIITAGGVSTKEINQKTMESKLVRGLFFAGEIIDIDADTGGYNLQIAYSTGWLAGLKAAKARISE